jgi:hypothetical protein
MVAVPRSRPAERQLSPGTVKETPLAQQSPTEPDTRPEDRTPEQIAADQAWLAQLRADYRRQWGGLAGGHDAFLDSVAD